MKNRTRCSKLFRTTSGKGRAVTISALFSTRGPDVLRKSGSRHLRIENTTGGMALFVSGDDVFVPETHIYGRATEMSGFPESS